MLEFLPKKPPSLTWLLEQLGNPSNAQLAEVMKVDPRTVRRWIKRDYAPMPVMWTLYSLTPHGRTEREYKALNKADMYEGLVQALRDEVKQAQAEIRRLCARLDQLDQAANGPLYELVLVRPDRRQSQRHEAYAKW